MTHIPKKQEQVDLIMVDLFCGAGGTTQGAEQSGRCKVIAAVNHDPIAIASHSENHGDVYHATEDVRTLDLSILIQIVQKARKKYPQAKLIIWASLECTNHSKAKGGLPRDADSRTLAEHLPRYVLALDPDYVLIENVEEFMSWGPLDERGKPISRKCGLDYMRWIKSITDLGFTYDYRLYKAADFGAYTIRERYFGAFVKPKAAFAWPTPTHRKVKASGDLFEDNRPGWKPVKDVLDWSDLGRSIFDRKKPLVDKTLTRILGGLKKFHGLEPMLMTCNNPGYCKAITEPAGTITTRGHKALVSPMMFTYYGNSSECVSIQNAAPTVTTKDRIALVNSVHWMDLQFSSGQKYHGLNRPAGSVTTVPKMGLITAFIVNPQYNNMGNSVQLPAPTVIASQKGRPLSLASAIYQPHVSQNWMVKDGDTEVMRQLKIFMQENLIHDILMRMLKIPELKKIQGFPEDYILKGNSNDQKKFLGNAVVPDVVTHWMWAISAQIRQKSTYEH